VVGQKGFFKLLRFELITCCLRNPGAPRPGPAQNFLPLSLQESRERSRLRRGITLRHPHKIALGTTASSTTTSSWMPRGRTTRASDRGQRLCRRNAILSCKEGSIAVGDYTNIRPTAAFFPKRRSAWAGTGFLAGHCYLWPAKPPLRRHFPADHVPAFGKQRRHQDRRRVWLGAGVIVLDGASIGPDLWSGRELSLRQRSPNIRRGRQPAPGDIRPADHQNRGSQPRSLYQAIALAIPC